MANSICSITVNSLISPNKPGVLGAASNAPKLIQTHTTFSPTFQTCKLRSTVVKADDNPGTNANSLVCARCDGNGALACSQCQGTGVNSVDHFDGKFKAGGLCWLCRGKRDMLCGNCNGAGFMGGFMSTFDE